MAGYTKLFSDIVESSIWKEPSDVRAVWITLLALCDADGWVRGSAGWLADKAHVPLEVCCQALSKFTSPDPSSRTPDNDGRRIEALEDGWLILNYLKFRDRLSSDPKAVSSRERVRRHRERYRALRNAPSVTGARSASASEDGSASGSDSEGRGSGEGERQVTPPLDGPILPWIKKVRDAHPDFRSCTDDQIGNSLRAWPKENWEDGITDLQRKRAGSSLPVPLATLENYLAGKPQRAGEKEKIVCRLG